MEKKIKVYMKFIVVILVVIGLYFLVDSVTSLKIFPKKINSGQSYIALVKKYGLPKILKHTDLKLIQRGVTIIPGEKCRKNIYAVPGSNISKYSEVFDENHKAAVPSNSKNKPLNNNLQEGMIDKIFSNFQTYVGKLDYAVLNEETSDKNTEQTIKDRDKLKNLIKDNKKPETVDYNIKDNIDIKDNTKIKAKYYRADVYKSLLLAQFKTKKGFLIVTLEEKYYKCIFPEKTQFFTYDRKDDNSIMYYPRGITESQFEKYLSFKKNDNNKLAYFYAWKAKRSKATWEKFYRLYRFTIPTPITCMLINENIILYGNSIHKKSKLLKTVQKELKRN